MGWISFFLIPIDNETYIRIFPTDLWGCSSVVEHLPFKQRAEGSSPSTLT